MNDVTAVHLVTRFREFRNSVGCVVQVSCVAFIMGTLVGCNGNNREDHSMGRSPYVPVSLVQLIANPHRYDGIHVAVEGYAHLESESSGLYLSRTDYMESLLKNGLWIEITGDSPDVAKCNDRYVLIEGTFVATDLGHFGLWSGSVKDVELCGAIHPE